MAIGGISGDDRFLLVVETFAGMGMEVVSGTFQSFPSGRFFGEFQPLQGEHGSFHQSYMADIGDWLKAF